MFPSTNLEQLIHKLLQLLQNEDKMLPLRRASAAEPRFAAAAAWPSPAALTA